MLWHRLIKLIGEFNMKDVYLQEAFKALDILNEEDFSLDSNKELEDARVFINSDDDIDTIDIIDPDLSVDEDEEATHDPEDYVGKVILDCCTCHSKMYKNKEDIHIDEETGLANADEECPFCYSVDGYTLIGEVTPYEEESTDTEEATDIDEDETEIEDEVNSEDTDENDLEENLNESLNIGKLRLLIKRLNEAEMSDEDKHDSEILWDIYNKTQQRANAKLTDEEKEILKKYNLERSSDYKNINKLSPTPGRHYDGPVVSDKIKQQVNRWRSNTRESDINLADRARKMDDRGAYGYRGDFRYIPYGSGITSIDDHREYKDPETGSYKRMRGKGLLDAERDDQNARMTEPVRDMHAALSNRKYHGKKVADNDAEYNTRRETIQREYEKKLADLENSRKWSGIHHQINLDNANQKINKLLKRNKTDEALSDNKSTGKKVKITDIDWDIEGEDVKLPKSITVPMHQIVDSEDELKDTIADYLSDNYGWVVNSCNYEVINESLPDKAETLEEDANISEYQKWVDYDMEKYGRISGLTKAKLKRAGFSVVKDQYGEYEVIADRKDECVEDCEKEPVKEHFEKVEIETDKEKMNMTSDEDGKVTVTTEPKEDDVKISPVSDETQSEINPVSNDEDDYEDIDIDDFSEEEFNELGESYLKNVYENVNSFKVNNVSQGQNKLVIEGIIGFSSGKKKKTSFVFEAKNIDKQNRVKFIGENLQMSRGAKSFTLCGKVSNGKFISESLNYNYRTKDSNGESNRVYGTVKTNKR